MSKEYSIYCIENTVNHKKYVGQTSVGVRARWTRHRIEARNGSMFHLHAAIRKYGPELFSITLLETVASRESANSAEMRYIHLLDTYGTATGYNETRGGDTLCVSTPRWNKGLTKETDERLARASISMRASVTEKRRRDASTRMALNNPMKNPETVAKVMTHSSTSTRLKAASVRMAFKNPMKSDANRKRMVQNNPNADGHAFRGKKLSPERVDNIRQANLVRLCCLNCRLEGGKAAMIRYHVNRRICIK